MFHDLRQIPTQDEYYDVIVCSSTLEHVGCNNVAYTNNNTHHENNLDDFAIVMQELRRVLKSRGGLLITVPFGVYHNFGTFQQFDQSLLARAIRAFGSTLMVEEVFYRYTSAGWNVSTAEQCQNCEYVEWINRPRNEWPNPLPVEPDLAAAARAVACVKLVKD